MLEVWNNISYFITNNLTNIIVGLMLLNLLILIWLIKLVRSKGKLEEKYLGMMSGYEGQNIEQLIMDYRQKVDSCSENLNLLEQIVKKIEHDLSYTVQNVGLVRYNAFQEMGSDLSFSVAMLDGKCNGVVISSLYGRDQSWCYAKPVEGGTSTYKLTAEEESAINKALLQKI
ncbi:DUF4446 family protein [Bacillota bacterium LX-D]|nr:DUF4446 family protein [Bacillota bacterium LX-D]